VRWWLEVNRVEGPVLQPPLPHPRHVLCPRPHATATSLNGCPLPCKHKHAFIYVELPYRPLWPLSVYTSLRAPHTHSLMGKKPCSFLMMMIMIMTHLSRFRQNLLHWSSDWD
jgi:hypothetical protein